jgi:hypothetical protein
MIVNELTLIITSVAALIIGALAVVVLLLHRTNKAIAAEYSELKLYSLHVFDVLVDDAVRLPHWAGIDRDTVERHYYQLGRTAMVSFLRRHSNCSNNACNHDTEEPTESEKELASGVREVKY